MNMKEQIIVIDRTVVFGRMFGSVSVRSLAERSVVRPNFFPRKIDHKSIENDKFSKDFFQLQIS